MMELLVAVFVIQVAVFVSVTGMNRSLGCLTGYSYNGTMKSFTIDGKPAPLSIYIDSTSPANQITGLLAAILMEEGLGYTNVVFVNDSLPGLLTVSQVNAYITTRCPDQSVRCSPPVVIFPAVWVPMGDQPIIIRLNKGLVDLGSAGITASYGWFVSTSFVQELWKTNEIPADHWRSLQLPIVLSHLLNAGHLESVREWCNGCLMKVFYPPMCNPSQGGEISLCVLLLAQDRGSCNSYTEGQISSLHLPVVVAWLRTKPDTIVTKYQSRDQAVLFISFDPDWLTVSGSYTRIQFPNICGSQMKVQEPSNPHPPWNCSCQYTYELRKFAWSKLKDEYNDILHVLTRIHLQQHYLSQIIRQHTSNKNTTKVTCDWLKQNNRVWSPWLPTRNITKRSIYLGGMFPSLTGPEAVWSSPGDELGAIMAIEKINRDTAVLKDYVLKVSIVATQCRRELVLNAYISYLNRDASRKVVGILGPACSKPTIPIAAVSHYHNMVVMGYGADDVALSDRKRFPYFFRTTPSIDEFKFAYVALFDRFQWKRCVTLRDTRYPATTVVSRTEYMNKHGVDVMSREIPVERDLDTKAFVSSVKQSGQTIIIMNAYPSATRAIMCEAYKQNLGPSQGYVWFLIGWLDQDWWHTDKHNGQPYTTTAETVPCSSSEMKTLVDQGYFTLSVSFYGENDDVIQGGGTVDQWRHEYNKTAATKGVKPSEYASLAHDAVWTYALALDKLIKNSSTALDYIFENKTSSIFREYIHQTHFTGVSGLVHFRNGDRISIINIRQNFATTSKLIGRFVPKISQNNDFDGYLELDEKSIKWASGNVPSDSLPDSKGSSSVSRCAVESLRRTLGVSCTAAGLVAAAIAVFLIAVVLSLVFWILKGRYSSKYRSMKNRLTQLGLLDAQAASAIFALDTWELSRDMIVLNRKLGEGAFGAVFGGEGFGVPGQGQSVSIAVKTLKTNATVEEKFEFLGEADTMKHFSHENIVQLFGVCTTTEPVFIIMELMIHGDLKSFLLARRRLIDQHDTPEAEEVTPSNLTRMALDIAKGLHYLAQKKYVHRDLALRNCMVGLGNVIKIGDFGLARHLNIKDYYRFERKGALPIRWMSPEAITEGLFTTQSDVWSFGVTLWELATFGGFPYQGATNQVVLEHVKDGNILEIPPKSPEPMANLLRMCWRYHYLDRPTPYSLVQLLTEQPQLIHACVEVPPSTVTDDSIGRFYVSNAHARTSRMSRTPSVSSQLSERLRITGLLKETSLSSKKTVNNSSSGGHSPANRKTSFFFKL